MLDMQDTPNNVNELLERRNWLIGQIRKFQMEIALVDATITESDKLCDELSKSEMPIPLSIEQMLENPTARFN